MEAIIHPGMHKTGSSSIQATLMALRPEGWVYPNLRTGNMGGRFALLFENNPHEHRSFKARGATEAELQTQRVEHYAEFLEQLQFASNAGINTLFSGEYLSIASRGSLAKMASLYREYGFVPRVVAYVRKPMSYMQSAFQQRIKGGLGRLNEGSVRWPQYRDRFEKFDDIFGRENVQLIVFDSETLKNGDVCLDFYSRIGVAISSDQVVRVNDGLSLSACALLFAQRSLGDGIVKGYKGAPSQNNSFVAALSKLKGEPFRLKKSLVEAAFKKHEKDLRWMESRLEIPLSDLPDEDSPNSIGNEKELLAIADRHRDVLEDILIKEIKKDGKKPRDRLVRNLNLLRKIYC